MTVKHPVRELMDQARNFTYPVSEELQRDAERGRLMSAIAAAEDWLAREKEFPTRTQLYERGHWNGLLLARMLTKRMRDQVDEWRRDIAREVSASRRLGWIPAKDDSYARGLAAGRAEGRKALEEFRGGCMARSAYYQKPNEKADKAYIAGNLNAIGATLVEIEAQLAVFGKKE